MHGAAGLWCWSRIWRIRRWCAGRRLLRLVWRREFGRCSRFRYIRARSGSAGWCSIAGRRERCRVRSGLTGLRWLTSRVRCVGVAGGRARRSGARAVGRRAAALGGGPSGDGDGLGRSSGCQLDEAFVRLRAYAFAARPDVACCGARCRGQAAAAGGIIVIWNSPGVRMSR